MRRIACLLCLCALLIAGLSGCGQKGPLYLPDEKPGQEGQG